jgi:Tfp pilus assembly protein PilF
VVALVVAAYTQIWDDPFLLYDDDTYNNATVRGGLTLENIRWAFGYHEANWHPLTWLSHMLDWELWGMRPGFFKLHNAALHLGSGLMLLLFLRRAGWSVVRATLASALFAIHPLRVSSVAWVSERKDALAIFLCVAAMLAQQWHVRRPSLPRLALVTAMVALALMAKPIAVTLPFALLLLDLWPFQRADALAPRTWARPVLEKLPMFAMVVGASLLTFQAQSRDGAVAEHLSLSYRAQTASVAYATYLGKFFTLGPFAILYPRPDAWPVIRVAASSVVLLALSLFAACSVRRRPWWFVGWFWFAGTLVPVSGLISVGEHAYADRHTYLPHIGLAVLAAWQVGRWGWLSRPSAPAAALGPALIVSFVLAMELRTFTEVARFHDNERLFLHTLEVTGVNPSIETNLALYYEILGRQEDALRQVVGVVEKSPRHSNSWMNLLRMLIRSGRPEAARDVFNRLATNDPSTALKAASELEAISAARGLTAELPVAWRFLAAGLESRGDRERALQLYTRALNADPTDAASRAHIERLRAAPER